MNVRIGGSSIEASHQCLESPIYAVISCNERAVVARSLRHVERVIVGTAHHAGWKIRKSGSCGSYPGSTRIGSACAAVDMGGGNASRKIAEAFLDPHGQLVGIDRDDCGAGSGGAIWRRLARTIQRGCIH